MSGIVAAKSLWGNWGVVRANCVLNWLLRRVVMAEPSPKERHVYCECSGSGIVPCTTGKHLASLCGFNTHSLVLCGSFEILQEEIILLKPLLVCASLTLFPVISLKHIMKK